MRHQNKKIYIYVGRAIFEFVRLMHGTHTKGKEGDEREGTVSSEMKSHEVNITDT